MDDPVAIRVWIGRGIYLAVVCAIIFFKLLPLDSTPTGFPGPDLLVAVTFAWVIRRPQQVPVLLIAIVFFVCDMIFLRPPGLWTLIMLAATEFLRANTSPTRDMPFLAEWGVVSVLIVLSVFIEQIALSIFILPHPGLGLALFQVLITLIVYPVVVGALRYGLGLHHIAPGEIYDAGRRL